MINRIFSRNGSPRSLSIAALVLGLLLALPAASFAERDNWGRGGGNNGHGRGRPAAPYVRHGQPRYVPQPSHPGAVYRNGDRHGGYGGYQHGYTQRYYVRRPGFFYHRPGFIIRPRVYVAPAPVVVMPRPIYLPPQAIWLDSGYSAYDQPWWTGAQSIDIEGSPFYYNASLGFYVGGAALELQLGNVPPPGYIWYDPYTGADFYSLNDYRQQCIAERRPMAVTVMQYDDDGDGD